MPLLPATPLDRRKRLLAFAEDLLSEVATLDLDTIDGEFYWRWCKADLLESEDALLATLPRPVGAPSPRSARHLGSDTDTPPGLFEPESLFDYLREGLRFASDVLALSDALSRRYPRIVWQRLLDGDRVAMRAAEAEVHLDDRGGNTRRMVRLRVFSGAWTGRQVEEEIARLAAAAWINGTEEVGHPLADVGVYLRFAFADERQARAEASGDDPPRGAYVLVEVPLPLPPPQTIEREYEALVRQQRGWHLELPGSSSHQEKMVALRTWAIGLLVHEGTPVNDAIDVVCRHLATDDISPACFGQDRKRLLDRVPEAWDYLFSPTGSNASHTRADGPHALVPEHMAEGPEQPSVS